MNFKLLILTQLYRFHMAISIFDKTIQFIIIHSQDKITDFFRNCRHKKSNNRFTHVTINLFLI